ncbi:MAG: efflux RND transporter permease subunit, partial [Nitrospirota bacterium]
MNLTRLAIEKNRVTAVAVLVVVAAGLAAYSVMPRNEDPGFTIRVAQVITYFPGASPERVELLVTDKLEKVIQEIPELDFVNSESRTGVSIILVNVQERFDTMRPIWDDLRRKVERARADLPDGVIGPTVNDEFGDVFGVVITLTGEGFTYAELKTVADEVRDELLRLPEAAKVEIHGAQEERIFVEYNNARLAELGLSPYQLSQILASRNILIPGGSVRVGPERLALEPTGNFESVDDLRRTILNLPGRSEVVYLEDIAAVSRGYIDPPTAKVTAGGAPALALAISLREGGNIMALGGQVDDALARLQAAYPIGIELQRLAFQPAEVERKVGDFVANLLQAVAVVAAVMFLTLGLRTGVVVATLIPLAMVMAFWVMSWFHIGIDQISLAALIIALGLLVDNGIVMAESIMVQMAAGKEATAAAVDSAAELRVPLLTASLTTAAAFLPIYLAESTTGEYTAPLFKVVTITLVCSWVIALTVIPLLAVHLIRVRPAAGGGRYDGRFFRAYRGTLLLALRYRWLTLVATIAAFAAAIYGLGRVPNIFFPPSDRAMFTAALELPLGTAIEETEAVVADLDRHIQTELAAGVDRPHGVTTWAAYVGNGGPRFVLQHEPKPASPYYALMVANVTDVPSLPGLMARLEGYAGDSFPDLQMTVRQFENGPPITRPVEVRVSGRETDRLFAIVDDLKGALAAIPGTKNVSDDWGSRAKKLLVRINQPRARRAGVTSQDIAVSLQTGLSGLELTEYREGDQVIPITMRSVAADRQDIGKLESLAVYAQATGRSVPLKQVADVEMAWEAAKILRRDRLKTVTVGAELEPGVTAAEAFAAITPWLEAEAPGWGLGYRYELGGEAETSAKANASIAAKLPIAGLIILLLLVGQFNSIRRPIIILLTIPLGMIGVTVGLLVARSYFGFMTLLGIISLAGIVINNAIVLLERIQLEIVDNRRTPQAAVVAAAQHRLRPILLTTATTVCGLLPLYFGGGEMWEPMAVAIISGLLF